MKTLVAPWFATALLAAAPACSLRTANQVPCADDSTCEAAFGAGSVCQADGYCSEGSGDGDGDGDGDGGPTGPWTFVSVPDFLNADIGDVSALTDAVNSTNSYHEAAIELVLDAIAAEDPDFVMVAGDLVNGHWIQDADNVQVFGPVGTRAEKAAAIDTAANVYYAQWKERFAARDLTVYAAVGDHDVGDNPWPAGSDKAFLVENYKQAWARHFTLDAAGDPVFELRPAGTPYENTAYAVRHKNVLVVTVDEFYQEDPAQVIGSEGSVRNVVTAEQIEWLDGLLADAAADSAIDHIIVQGHVPVLLPVRQQNSSGLTMPGGANSELWDALVRHGVDLYFAGEVHDMSTANSGGVEQVVHGGIMGYAPNFNYLVGRVYPDRIELELKRAALVYTGSERLWQAGSNRPKAQYAIGPDGFVSAGTLIVDKSTGATEYLSRSGFFIPLGTGAGEGLSVHLPFEEPAGSALSLNHGTTASVNDAMVGGATSVTGILGSAMKLGAGDRLPAGPPPVVGSDPRTTSIWVRVPPGPGPEPRNGIRTVFTLGTNKPGTKWDFDVDAEGLFEVGLGMGRGDSAGSSAVNDNQWHHLVATAPQAGKLDDIQLYVDGVPIAFIPAGENNPAINTDPAGPLILGHAANSTGFQQFVGEIDDLAIWGRQLSAAQIKALYSAGTETTLRYNAGDLEAMFAAFANSADAIIRGRLWRYTAEGLTSAPGEIELNAGVYSLNLGAGAGFTSGD